MDINFGSGGGGMTATVIPVLAGVLVGGIITGAWQWLQRRFDAKEKAKDRANTIRRDVYLAAVEHIVGAIGNLASLPVRETDQWIKANNDLLSSLQKLQIVGGRDTCIEANNLNRLFAEAIIPLLVASAKIKNSKLRCDAGEDTSQKQMAELTRLNQAMASHFESPGSDPIRHERLKASKEQAVRFCQESLEHQLAASQEYARLNKEYMVGLAGPLAPITNSMMKLLNFVRDDLGLPRIDDAAMKAIKANADHLKSKFIDLPSAFHE